MTAAAVRFVAPPVEQATAGFEPADNGRAGHAAQYGRLAGSQQLVWFGHWVYGLCGGSSR
jgi:hypothetical protein